MEAVGLRAKLSRVEKLMQEEKSLKVQIKKDTAALHALTKETIEQLEISEGSAKFSGEEITSDMRFGFKVSGYIHALWNALFKEQGTKKVELGIRLFEEPAEKLSKIFNL